MTCYKLSPEDKKLIKKERLSGKTYFQIAEKFNITFQYAQSICCGKTKIINPSEDLENEKWKIVPSIPVLLASNLGRIKRLETSRVYKRNKLRLGYVQIGFSYKSKKMAKLVHRLVAEAWIGPCPKTYQVNHKDGNKLNNTIENLEYVTPSENDKHAYKTGLKNAKGSKNGRSKLTEEDVLEIRRLRKQHVSLENIAKLFDITKHHCQAIICREYWTHI